MFDNADEVEGRIQEDVRRALQRAERMPELVAATQAARGRAVSRERDISVEVDHTGQVTSLQIANEALRRGGTRLAAEILSLLNQARHEVQKQMLAAATGVLGEDDPLLDPFRVTVEAETIANPGTTPPKSGGLW